MVHYERGGAAQKYFQKYACIAQKHCHGIKCQSVVASDGLFGVNLWPEYMGIQHDTTD
jgi:hypothetical protein